MTITDVQRVRSFNRTWTEVLGLLDQGLLATEHSLSEARVLFELAQRPMWERLDLRQRLGMDASFLTRVLTRLEADGLVVTAPSPADTRRLTLALTARGRSAAAELDARSSAQIDELLAPLTAGQRRTVGEAMTVISAFLRRRPPAGAAARDVQVRGLHEGDVGWVIERHGEIYFDEFGWNIEFEVLVARIVADYLDHHRPGQENAWIVTVDGARAGCVFCCRRDATTAQLRILLVEPWARGLGLGARLVAECIGFARAAGYAEIVLWTNDVLVAARRIYQAAGFELVDEEPHHSFGHDLVGQNWRLDLTR
jgi:DNA-binding MarR family transcriptional regulator/N-acetylglutamate synthase-like GNAT family acetyltransferase